MKWTRPQRRIRQEVDEEANIIVGATFDESLDGIIRVSVVATGIDQGTIARAAATPAAKTVSAAPDPRAAELTAKLREDNKRASANLAQKSIEPRPAAQPVQPAQAPTAQPAANVERAALEAIAAAVAEPTPPPPAPAPVQPASYGDVTVRPIAQKPTLFPDHDPAPREQHEPPPPENFIPQPAERAPVRVPRMPRMEELPMPAQNEIRQARGEVDGEHPQKIGCHSCNVWPMLASAGAIRTPSLLSRVARPGQPWLRCLHCRSASRSAALPSRWVTSRYQSTRAVRRLKDWILTAVRFLLRPLRKATITWISPLFFAARPTEVCNN